MGVDWLIRNVPIDGEDRYRTQTSVHKKNNDRYLVVTKPAHYNGQLYDNEQAKIIRLGHVAEDMLAVLTAQLERVGCTVELEAAPGGLALTQTELKRRKLLQQLAEIDKEEQCINAVRATLETIPDIKITSVKMSNDNQKGFAINVIGKFKHD